MLVILLISLIFASSSYLTQLVGSESSSIYYFEGFDDDFDAGRNVPDLVDTGLSSSFSAINEKRPSASGFLTIRDRDILWEPGDQLFPSAWVDFTDGRGTYMTFRFDAGLGYAVTGGTVSFDVVACGDDAGTLYKYISSDGVTFTQVGDDSDAQSRYTFSVATGGSSTYFRLKVGTSAGIWDGVHVDNIKAILTVSPQPPEPTHYTLTITTLSRGTTDPSAGIYTYPVGTVVEVTATPYAGYYLDHWQLDGDNVGSSNPVSITMNANHTLNAIFYYGTRYTLTITTTTGGTTTPSPGIHSYWNGTTVTVSALPYDDYIFDHWELDGSWFYSNPIDITMNSNHTLHAVFQYFPVGGIVSPFEKFGSWGASYIVLAIVVIAITIGAIYAQKRWLRKIVVRRL